MDFHSAEYLSAVMTFTFEQAGQPVAEFLPGGERFSDALIRVKAALFGRTGLAPSSWHTKS